MTAAQKGHIFISYRRDDSAGYAGRIFDRLSAHFGKDAIFMDVDTIEAGLDFVEVLENAVQSCNVLVVLIGKQWLNIKNDAGKRRLDNSGDFVRIEVAAALGRDIRVIPVLLNGVSMPSSSELPENLKSLERRNAIPLNHYSFNADAERLITQLELALRTTEKTSKEKSQDNLTIKKKDAIRTAREREQLERTLQLQQSPKLINPRRKSRKGIVGGIAIVTGLCLMLAITSKFWQPVLSTSTPTSLNTLISSSPTTKPIPSATNTLTPPTPVPPPTIRSQYPVSPEHFLTLYFDTVIFNKDFTTGWNFLTNDFQTQKAEGWESYIEFWSTVNNWSYSNVQSEYLGDERVRVIIACTLFYNDGNNPSVLEDVKYCLLWHEYYQNWKIDLKENCE